MPINMMDKKILVEYNEIYFAITRRQADPVLSTEEPLFYVHFQNIYHSGLSLLNLKLAPHLSLQRCNHSLSFF